MNFWINFWMWILGINLIIFAGVAIVVIIGGFGNVLSMLLSLKTRHENNKLD